MLQPLKILDHSRSLELYTILNKLRVIYELKKTNTTALQYTIVWSLWCKAVRTCGAEIK